MHWNLKLGVPQLGPQMMCLETVTGWAMVLRSPRRQTLVHSAKNLLYTQGLLRTASQPLGQLHGPPWSALHLNIQITGQRKFE